jgi:hypothetical protein
MPQPGEYRYILGRRLRYQNCRKDENRQLYKTYFYKNPP